MNSCKMCDLCNNDVHRASFAKRLRSKKHLANEKHNELIVPEWLFHEPIENKPRKIYKAGPLWEKTGDNFELDEKQLNKESAKKMINSYYLIELLDYW